MGQTLSEPSQEKHTSEGNNERFAYAVSEMQGWRISMEDAHTTILELDDKHKDAFFAVFDGHGGSSIARYSGQHVHVRLAADEAYASKDYQAALKKAFLGTDDDLRTDPAFYHDPSGCTAVAALITSDGKIYCANAGDSRAVMSVKGEAEPLSFDHKPQNKAETQRITAAGGYVLFNRVNGNLALSRAIGDFEFKQNYALPPEEQIVTVNPDITVHDLTPEDEFLVIACDGIWDCMSSQDVINWTRHQISQKIPLSQICEDMMSRCLSPDSDIQGGIGCDNMTVMVIALLGERTLDEWYSWVAERVENQVGFNTPREYPPLYPPSQIGGAAGRGGIGGGRGGLRGLAMSDGTSMFGSSPGDPGGFLTPSWLQRLNRPLYISQSGLSSLLPVGSSSSGGGAGGVGSFDDSGDEYEYEDSDEEMEGGSGSGSGSGTGSAGSSSFLSSLSGMTESSTGSGEGGSSSSASSSNGLHAPPARDATSSLRAQLEALDREDVDMGSSGHPHHPMQVEEPEDDVETDVRHRGIGGGHNVMQFGAINGVLGGRLYNYDEDKEDRFEEDGDDIDLDDDDDEEEIAYSALNPRPPKIIGAPLVQAPQALADLGRSRSPATSRKSSSAGAPASAASPSTSKPGGETPPPPRPQTELEKNDNTLGKLEQAAPTPGGDKPSDAVKMEGLMDGHKAEDPLGN